MIGRARRQELRRECLTRIKTNDRFGCRAERYAFVRVTPRSYHRSVKIAISVPDEIFEAGEHLAKQLGLSRSKLYADALAAYLSDERGAAAVTAQLNAVDAQESSKLDAAFAKSQLNCVADEAW